MASKKSVHKHFLIHKVPLAHALLIRPRLLIAALVGLVIFLVLPDSWRGMTKFLVGWDGGVMLYLALVSVMMARSNEGKIRQRAAVEDEGGLIILGVTVFGALVSLAAIVNELATAKALSGHEVARAIIVAAATVFLSWLFIQTAFALHYAHEYYSTGRDDAEGGLEFPGHFTKPDYWDFIYFSYIIGTAAATADINLTSQTMRRIVTLQCVTVFFFNTSILALAINVGAGLT